MGEVVHTSKNSFYPLANVQGYGAYPLRFTLICTGGPDNSTIVIPASDITPGILANVYSLGSDSVVYSLAQNSPLSQGFYARAQ